MALLKVLEFELDKTSTGELLLLLELEKVFQIRTVQYNPYQKRFRFELTIPNELFDQHNLQVFLKNIIKPKPATKIPVESNVIELENNRSSQILDAIKSILKIVLD